MSSKRFEISPALDTADLAKGTTGAERSLEKLEDAVQDASRVGTQDLDKMQDDLRDVGKHSRKTSDALADVGGRGGGFAKAADASAEFKSEALQNFSEIASSFDGSTESIGELAQGTLGGIASSIPGIGIAGGIAAIGVGAITNALSEAAERSKEIKDDIISAFLELGDALDPEAVQARFDELLGDESARKEAELLAGVLDIDFSQALLAMAGDFASAGVTAEEAIDGIRSASSNVDLDVWNQVKSRLESVTEGLRIGREVARYREEALKLKHDAERAQIERNMDAATARYEAMAAAFAVPIEIDVAVDRTGLTVAEDRLRVLQNRAASGGVTLRPGAGRTWE